MLKLAPLLALIVVTSSLSVVTSSLSEDWGLLKLKNRLNKCYSYDQGQNQLWTRDCNKWDNLQLWRYDATTQQLQNKGMTLQKGSPYCAVQSAIGNLKPIRMGPCYNNNYNKFIMATMSYGTGEAHRFALLLSQGTCIDVDNWSVDRDENVHTSPCEAFDKSRTDHWTVFERVEAYKGKGLASLPKQASFSDGDWGALRISPRLQECWGVKVTQKCAGSGRQADYRGTISVTQHGVTCQAWGSQSPHTHINTPEKKPNSGLKGNNYCRNPDNEVRAWCYTTGSTRWDYCSVPADSCTSELELQQQPCDSLDQGQIWRYNIASRTISNYRFPLEGRNNGCLTYRGSRHYIEQCNGRTEQQYYVNDGVKGDGTYQQVAIASHTGRCIDVDGWNSRGVHWMHSSPCESINTKNSDHWYRFDYVEAGVVCRGGMYREGQQCIVCPQNTYSKEGSNGCTKCAAGFEANKGSATCTRIQPVCPMGTFVNAKAAVKLNSCILCPVNTYSDLVNAASCNKCPVGYEAKRRGSTSCTRKVQNCPMGTFVNGKAAVTSCILCPVNSYSDLVNSASCTKCPVGYEAKRRGSTSCTEVKVTITAVRKSGEVVCKLNKKKPACLVQCRFRTSNGVSLKNPGDVTFYKKVGGHWVNLGASSFNTRYNWHSYKLATKPQAGDQGQYKCEINYQGITAKAEVAVKVNKSG